MKKILLIFSILASSVIYSQIEKGAWLFGPSFSYSQGGNNNDQTGAPTAYSSSSTSNYFSGTLRLGYFVTNKMVVGLIGGYSTSSDKQKFTYGNPVNFQTTNSITNIGSFGLFARIYKLYNENKFGFFCQLDGTYQSGNYRSVTKTDQFGEPPSTETTGDITGVNVGLRPGIVYFITKRIGLESSFGSFAYNSQTQQNYSMGQKISKNTSNGLNVNFGLNTFYLGINFYFARKKG